MEFELGKPVQVEMLTGATLRGFVHAVDTAANLLCLERIPSAELALISIANIKSVVPIDNDLAEHRRWPSNPQVDTSRARANSDRIFQQRHAKYTRVGVGVSAAAQAVFDALAKTMPCKWDRDVIVVLDSVHLEPPYDMESISGGEDGVVSRVKMVLKHEAKNIRTALDMNGFKA